MAQQDEGWPLGLQPLNARIVSARNPDNSGSISFNTLLTGSPSSSTDSSSDLDTESTGSFFRDKSTTLGSLIGVSSILELSRRSLRGVKTEVLKRKKGNKSNFGSWLLGMCWRTSLDSDKEENVPSLGHFLAVERRTANENRRTQSLPIYGCDEFAPAQTTSDPNSLFVNGRVAPPRQSYERERDNRQGNGFGSVAELFPCLCGKAAGG